MELGKLIARRTERTKLRYTDKTEAGRCRAFMQANPEFMPTVIEVAREIVAQGFIEIPLTVVLGVAQHRMVFVKGHPSFIRFSNGIKRIFFGEFLIALAPDLKKVFPAKKIKAKRI